MRRWFMAGVGAALLLSSATALADARATAEAARSIVVKIVAQFPGESPATKHGFGFIVGERDGFLYVVTANHVVRGDVDDSPAGTTDVRFYSDQGISHPATLLETHRRPPTDLAVLRVAKPAAMLGAPFCDDGLALRRDTPATYVGRDGEWYVPAVDGTVNSDSPDEEFHAEVDFSGTVAVKEGTSGGPLISPRGLLGMVILDSNSNVATVLATEAIARAFHGWNYPWLTVTCEPPPPPHAHRVEVGLRVGYGRPFGVFSDGNAAVSDFVAGTSPLGLDAGVQLTPGLTVGGLFQYARVFVNDAVCGVAADPGVFYLGDSCSAQDIRFDVMVRYRRFFRRFAAWGAIGSGYHWLTLTGSHGSLAFRGFQVANLEAGADLLTRGRVGIGPFVSLAFSRFDWGRNTIDDPAGSADPNLRERIRVHEWFFAGVRMNVGIW